MKLKSISLENFKAFKKLDNLEFTPITIFCGSNSSGKSTIIQSLLLIKQTIESSYDKSPLLLNGDYIQLESYKNIVFGKNEKNEIKLECLLDHETKDQGVITTRIASTFKFEEGNIIVKNVNFFESNKKGDKTVERNLSIVHNQQDKYQLTTENMKEFLGFMIKEEITFDSKRIIPIKFKAMIPTPVISEGPKDINLRYGIYAIIDRPLQHIFSGIHYIGPLRDFPKRRDWRNPDITEIGLKGENAANVLMNETNQKLEGDFFLFDYINNKFEKSEESSLFGRLSVWADLLNFHLVKKDTKAN